MADTLTLEESSALRTFLERKSPLSEAVRKFCLAKTAYHEQQCAGNMASVPRQFERASDEASKAEAYREFLSELRFFSEKS